MKTALMILICLVGVRSFADDSCTGPDLAYRTSLSIFESQRCLEENQDRTHWIGDVSRNEESGMYEHLRSFGRSFFPAPAKMVEADVQCRKSKGEYDVTTQCIFKPVEETAKKLPGQSFNYKTLTEAVIATAKANPTIATAGAKCEWNLEGIDASGNVFLNAKCDEHGNACTDGRKSTTISVKGRFQLRRPNDSTYGFQILLDSSSILIKHHDISDNCA